MMFGCYNSAQERRALNMYPVFTVQYSKVNMFVQSTNDSK